MAESNSGSPGQMGSGAPDSLHSRVARMTYLDPVLRSEFLRAMDKLHTDPMDAAVRLRRCVESLAKQISTDTSVSSDTLDRRIAALQAEGVLPKHIASHMHTVRKIGNYAVHPEPEDPPLQSYDVEPAGAALLAILEWRNAESCSASAVSNDLREPAAPSALPWSSVSAPTRNESAGDMGSGASASASGRFRSPGTGERPRIGTSRATSQYYVYENWRADGHKAKIHFAHCSYCNHGDSTGRGKSGVNGQWHGPLDSFDDAVEAARQTGGRVSCCGVCVPS